jgi:hypothetical protein
MKWVYGYYPESKQLSQRKFPSLLQLKESPPRVQQAKFSSIIKVLCTLNVLHN